MLRQEGPHPTRFLWSLKIVVTLNKACEFCLDACKEAVLETNAGTAVTYARTGK